MRHMLLPWIALSLIACASSVTAPGNAIRLSGNVTDGDRLPVEVEVYERCSPSMYFFENCPGKQIGRAKIPKPGNFLVAIDTLAEEISVVAFRGLAPGKEEQCAVRHISARPAPVALELNLVSGPCPIERPTPITASARAPYLPYSPY